MSIPRRGVILIWNKLSGARVKILLATDCYTFQTGGITTVVVSLEKGLREKGHEVKVLALSNTHKSYRDGDSYYLGSLPFPDYPEHRFTFNLKDPLVKELIEWNPDLIHMHTEFTICRIGKYIAHKTNTPIVMTTHTDFEYFNFGRFRNTKFVTALGKSWGKGVYKEAVKVIVPSIKAKSFAHLLPHQDKVIVIPNGIETERYRKPFSAQEKQVLMDKLGFTDNGHTLVMITRLSKEKNVMEILQYMPALLKAVPDAQLLLVGDGPDRKRLQKFSADNNLNAHVRFTGRIDPSDVYKYYNLGDVFVSASLFELHSMSYLEALSVGLPLVCREDMSLRGVLEDGENGYMYETQSEYVTKTARLLTDKELHKQMHIKALAKADDTDVSRFIENSEKLYMSVVN